jgi:hypothetical protein
LYRCDAPFLTLRKEHRLRVFENRVLKRIFGPKREEVAEGWRRRQNQLRNRGYYDGGNIKEDVMGGA